MEWDEDTEREVRRVMVTVTVEETSNPKVLFLYFDPRTVVVPGMYLSFSKPGFQRLRIQIMGVELDPLDESIVVWLDPNSPQIGELLALPGLDWTSF